MGKHLLACCIIALSLLSFIDLSIAWSALLCTILALLLFLHQREHARSTLPPVSIYLIAYVVAYPVVIFFPNLYQEVWRSVPPYTLGIAMLWAVRGFAGFVCGYLLVNAMSRHIGYFQRQTAKDLDRRIAYARYVVRALGILSLCGYITLGIFYGRALGGFIGGAYDVQLASAAGSTRQFLFFLKDLGIPFFFAFGILYNRKWHNRHLVWLFCVVLALAAMECILMGSKAVIIRLVAVAVLVVSCTAKRISGKQFLAGAVSLLAVYMAFAIIAEYRVLMRELSRTRQDIFSISTQTETFSQAFLASLPFAESATVRKTEITGEDVIGRISSGGMFSFANLLQATGRRSPYEYAEKIPLLPIYAFTPRFLLPDKPEFFNSMSNAIRFYHRYDVTISVSTLGSLYFALGYPGVVLGMAGLGCLFAFLIWRIKNKEFTSINAMILFSQVMVEAMRVDVEFQSLVLNFSRVAGLLLTLRLLYSLIGGNSLLGVRQSPSFPHVMARQIE